MQLQSRRSMYNQTDPLWITRYVAEVEALPKYISRISASPNEVVLISSVNSDYTIIAALVSADFQRQYDLQESHVGKSDDEPFPCRFSPRVT